MGLKSDEIPAGFSSRMGLFLARFCTSAWMGAASLFVVVSVTEVTFSGFDPTIKDSLVSLRFPIFYWCGAILVGVGWFGVWLAGTSNSFPVFRRLSSLVLLAIILLLMVVDYIWIYQPLLQMVVPPGRPKPVSFAHYHETSKWINVVSLGICMVVSCLTNWPVKPRPISSHDVDPRNHQVD